MAFQIAYHTDIGIRKKTNQDGLLIKTAKTPKGMVGLFALCDGMGGLSQGELASATVIRGMSDWFRQDLPEILKLEEQEVQEESILTSLKFLIKGLNEKILQYGAAEKITLGTTITAMVVIYSRYYIVQIGDSRAYSINDQIQQLTVDQTLVVRELVYGNITEQQAKLDPRRNILLQCIGATNDIDVIILKGNIQVGTLYMLCTDGFYHRMTDQEMLEAMKPELFSDEQQMKTKLVELVELVKWRKETDNISLLTIKIM